MVTEFALERCAIARRCRFVAEQFFHPVEISTALMPSKGASSSSAVQDRA
jgi:hypothetical protein